MSRPNRIEGVYCAVATPITAEGKPDSALLATHCLALLDEGCHGLAVLGATGEGTSFPIVQRIGIVETAAQTVGADKVITGIGMTSVGDTIEMIRQVIAMGVGMVMMLPPYFYKGVSVEGLYRYYATVIEGVGDGRLRLILYHYPQVSQVPLPQRLVAMLIEAFPGAIAGIKDCSGDLRNMEMLTRTFPSLSILSGTASEMLPLLTVGGTGCIAGTANLCATDLRLVWDHWDNPTLAQRVDAAQARILAWRKLAASFMPVPTVKAMVARRRGNAAWLTPLPPLDPLPPSDCQTIWQGMQRLGA